MERWREAEEIFLSETRRHPKGGFLHHILGVFYLRTGRGGGAAFHLRKAIQYTPYYRGYYKKKRVWQRGKVHLDQKTESIIRKIPLNYHYAQFHNFIGLCLARERKSVQAVRELRKASKLEPDEFLFHANLGTVYYHQGAYQKAIQEYKQALKIDSFYGMGYANLSYVYGLIQRTREALRCMEKAVRLNPRYADLHYNLGLLYSDRRRYEKAISELKKALRINPNYLFARINLGVLYEDQEKWKEARREYLKVLQITPEDEQLRKRLERIS
jgi:tetratricopeptide (TPR) repeat protein